MSKKAPAWAQRAARLVRRGGIEATPAEMMDQDTANEKLVAALNSAQPCACCGVMVPEKEGGTDGLRVYCTSCFENGCEAGKL